MDYSTSSGRENKFLIASIILSALAFFSVQFVVLPFIFGGLAIIFAILSKGESNKMCGGAISSIVASVLSMILTVCMTAFIMYLIMYNKDYRSLLNDYSTQLYGQSFDKIVEESFNIELPDISK